MHFFLIFLFGFLSFSAAHAQDRLGVIAGANFADVQVSPGTSNTSMESFFLAGAYADIGMTEDLFFEPQLRFNSKGAGATNTTSGQSIHSVLRLKYLELPLYLKLKFNGDNFRPSLFIGPNFGVCIGDSISRTNEATGSTVTVRNTVGSELRKFDLAIDAGAGMEFMLSASLLGRLAVSYSYGLIDLDRSKNFAIRTRGIQVYGGIAF